MDKEMFPQVVQVAPRQGKVSYEKKCVFHEKLLYHYLNRKIDGWSVREFLDKERVENYVLYGVTDFTTLFVKDIEKEVDAYISGMICDKNAEAFQFEYKKWQVILPEKLVLQYKEKKVSKIIIMSILHENEIIDELLKQGIQLNDIVSFVSILYS